MEKEVVDDTSCKIVLSSYMNMLFYSLIYESSKLKNEHEEDIPKPEHFVNEDAQYWKDDPVLERCLELNIISPVNGKGKATQFYYNPEKDLLITANPHVYNIFSRKIYDTTELTMQPEGFIVFQTNSYETPLVVQKNFFELHSFDQSTEKRKDTYFGIVVIEADPPGVYSHYIETLEDVFSHAHLLYYFFHSEQGHPQHKISSFCFGKTPFYLPKSFDIEVYNEFRKMYCLIFENPDGRLKSLISENLDVAFSYKIYRDFRPTPVHDELKWIKKYLHKGSLVVVNDYVPYRFKCFRGIEIYVHKEDICPLICVEINFFPIAYHADDDIKSDIIAMTSKTSSSNPLRNYTIVEKLGNRFEYQVVRLMAAKCQYCSPFVKRGDYWLPVDNTLLFALRGMDYNAIPFTWADHRKFENFRGRKKMGRRYPMNFGISFETDTF